MRMVNAFDGLDALCSAEFAADIVRPMSADIMNRRELLKSDGYRQKVRESLGYHDSWNKSGIGNRQTKIFEIPSQIAQTRYSYSIGDYCAKYNFMREEYAVNLGLSVDRQRQTKITIANGTSISTAGTATTTFRFYNEGKRYSLVFHLVPNCIHNFILGKPFLKATKTFSVATNFARRVKERIVKSVTQHDLLYLGDAAPRFKGRINGKAQEALADSGAKIMIMDEDFAQGIGLLDHVDRDYRIKLRFADTSTAYTSGMIHLVQWEFGPGGPGKRYFLDFHILKNAPANVILSDTFLFGTEAFSRYDCYLVDEQEADDDDDAFFFAIDIDTKYLHQQPGDRPSAADTEYFELVRRGEEEDRIADLPLGQRDAAWLVENERRGQWDQRQTTSHSPSPSSNTQALHSLTTSPGLSIPQQQSSSPAPSSKSRWRFKLKRRSPT